MINYIQDRLTFKPKPDYNPERIPKDCVIEEIGEADFKITVAYKIRNLQENTPRSSSDVFVINCHGNASNISNLSAVYEFYNQTEFSYLLFDYPGYGASKGKPSEIGCYQALDEAIKFVNQNLGFDYSQIVLHGISLGGAIAIEGLTKYPVKCGVVDSTITNNIEMAKVMFKVLPLWRLVKPRFDSLSKVQKISTPILFFHGMSDEIIPYQMSQKLFDHKIGKKELVLIPNLKHTDLAKVRSPEIIEKFINFIISN